MGGNVRNKKSAKKRVQSPFKTIGFFQSHLNQAKRSFAELWVRPLGNLLTLAVISMALAMPSCLYLLGKNIAAVADTAVSPSQISAYLAEQTPEARIMVLKDEIESRDNVAKVDYISSQQGLDDLSQYAGFEQAISLLDDYSLPSVLIITPSEDDNDLIKALVGSLKAQQEITDIRLDEDWLVRLDAIQALISVIVIALSLLMLSSVFLIVGNTLRFNVLANKDEIQTMKLIGATNSFILRPYVYSGMWFGLLGALCAWILTALITILLNGTVEDLAMLYDSHFRLIGLSWDESLLLIILGLILGCAAAKVSAQRHLKEIEPV
ncbi:permease-like cell division protein FtsX [Vibrio genomosp. F10]|uniref:Cell division protein FtsX n=2 Tax=Vibrio genomosp. F10 TaxID=723171 RepID=A0A1E5BHD9_9VIBR|nr:permease-like cell division protein FtsX [Vibrio genomosp. F10]OEE36251.1 cell division protein FtsX [Vibrio genomosp. F10 str. ZF-129]OEE98535.1 cell division protein FtsX [Vibrio genomosp. F10 str. 9ZC157]OEF04230.1 cell division protein FtsX [Vibrio genomosp. F10 str. 9ZB36]OEF04449.1 cell division protein FtsX [Vibrio genomosp. F10 str. 9ZD137]